MRIIRFAPVLAVWALAWAAKDEPTYSVTLKLTDV
jgi:hypothetical protein